MLTLILPPGTVRLVSSFVILHVLLHSSAEERTAKQTHQTMTLFPGTNDFNKNPFAKVYDNIQCKKARPADCSVLF